jgi:ABC-2 type transport system permease protein
MRLAGMVRKESLQILRDPSSIAIAFVMPVVLLLIFGYGVSLDAKDVPIALVVENPSTQTTALTGGFQRSEFFAPRMMSSIQEAERALMRREVRGIVWLRSNFGSKSLAQRPAAIGVILNGVDANQARIVEGYVQGVWSGWLEQAGSDRNPAPEPPVRLEQRVWFNPAVRSTEFLVPGLIAVIMTLIGALLTALVVAREWDRGTLEALMVSPIRMRELLFGKLAPYFVLGMGGLTLSVIMAVWLFGVPLRGSLWALVGASSLFMLVALLMGLLISMVSKDQFVAGQVAIIATFLPAFILSGFIFDIGSMPAAVQVITHVVPARYFVAILQTLFLAGNVWPVVLANALALAGMAGVLLLLVRRAAVKRLE